MDKTFDRTRDYGTIYGDTEKHRAYEQDGSFYTADYRLVEDWSSPEKIEQERKQAQTRKAREAALAARREERDRRRKLEEDR